MLILLLLELGLRNNRELTMPAAKNAIGPSSKTPPQVPRRPSPFLSLLLRFLLTGRGKSGTMVRARFLHNEKRTRIESKGGKGG